MINLKTLKEIETMKEGGRRLRKVVEKLRQKIRVGITTATVDQEAERLIKEQGGTASFKKVKGYHFATCLPINEQVVHTPPSKRRLKEGDLLTVDIGMYYKGFHTDYADTMVIGGQLSDRTKKFLETGRRALYKAIEATRGGHRLGKVSLAIERQIYSHGYFILKQLTGHGIGRKLHEDPYVFGFLDGPIDKTPLIRAGLVIAIEVIYSMGTEEIVHEVDNRWSVVTADHSLSACFEHTVAITDKDTFILT